MRYMMLICQIFDKKPPLFPPTSPRNILTPQHTTAGHVPIKKLINHTRSEHRCSLSKSSKQLPGYTKGSCDEKHQSLHPNNRARDRESSRSTDSHEAGEEGSHRQIGAVGEELPRRGAAANPGENERSRGFRLIPETTISSSVQDPSLGDARGMEKNRCS